MADAITITIDGVSVATQPGKMVLEAAMDAGIYVPYLCYHPGMKPYAACRMCVVSVEGQRGYPAACTLPVQDGMQVRSEAPEVDQLRRSVMEMLIAEHPNGCLTCHRIDICGPSDVCLRHVAVNDRCVTCPKNERCELKDTVRYLGMNLESPLGYKYRNLPLEVADPFYDRDYNLCIVCGRCVRACEELRGDDAIGFTERSGQALVGTSFGSSLLESGCEFCGACIDVCPVGALVERDHKWEKARRVERSLCPHCPVGCQLNLEFNERSELIRAVPELHAPANRGQACFKGKFGLEFVNDAARLHRPLIRRDGILTESSWDEALDYAAQRLAQTAGADFALLTSSTGTNEEHYLAQKFARLVMGSNHIDQSSNSQPELTEALEASLGYPAATGSLWDLEQAGCILVFNSNLTEEQNVVGVPIKRAARKSTKLIVIDARETELTRYADVWLRPAPGAELLLLGALHKALHDAGLEDDAWQQQNCESPATLHYALHNLSLDDASAAANVPAADISAAARLFGEAPSASVVYGLDNLPPGLRGDCVTMLVNLALLTGNVGKPGAGLYPMRRGTNEQGAYDVGCLPGRLPGYRRVDAPDDRRALEELWGAPIPSDPGMGLAELTDGGRELRLKAAYIIGDSPNLDGALDAGPLSALDFLLVQDAFLTPLAQRADVVLPRVTFAEKDGTFTNLERRVQRLRPAHPLPPGSQARPEGWVISELARRMGAAGFDYASPAAVWDEIARAAPFYGGISYRRLETEGALVLRTLPESPQPTQALYSGRQERGLQWPCPTPASKGTPTLYEDGFAHRPAEIVTPRLRDEVRRDNPEYPLWFVPGRVLLQQEREMSIVKGKRNRIEREEWVELNPQDAAAWGIAEGDKVAVETAEGRLPGVARFADSIPLGVVASTALFGQLAIEMQASDRPDPAARLPGLDIQPARLLKV